MKLLPLIALGSLALALNLNHACGATASGFVYCDANQDEQIDTGDVPLAGVLIVVTNTSGTFSNAVYSAAPNGEFVIGVPATPDTYVEYVHPLSLPPDGYGTLPPGGFFFFTLDGETQTNFAGNFLVNTPGCTNVVQPPPPPPVTNNNCCLVACGAIGGKKNKPQFTFAGSVLPACGATNGDTGVWEVIANSAKLRFQGCEFEILDCGEATNSNCVVHFMDFHGIGTLKGFNGCKSNFGFVYFDAHAEDRGSRGDSLYFRAFDADGKTLMLISDNSADATDIAPVSLCDGKVVVGNDCCKLITGGHHHDDKCKDGDKKDDDKDKDHGKGGKDKDDDHDKGKGKDKGKRRN